ncbi:hypothetical protein, partial [Corallococcus exiguus]|uniref:hypothetical protein n=1 Tax=Corallococcus exiguus TaxID=83462 RepID=UPI001C27B603
MNVRLGAWGDGGRRYLRSRGEGIQHALIARLQQCRQLMLKCLHVALVQDCHRAEGPLAQRRSAHERQQLGGSSQEGPLQGLHEEHVPRTRRHPRRMPQQLEFRLRAGFPRLPARRVLELVARAPQPVQVEVRGPRAAVGQKLH